jgi:hypothetical protein
MSSTLTPRWGHRDAMFLEPTTTHQEQILCSGNVDAKRIQNKITKSYWLNFKLTVITMWTMDIMVSNEVLLKSRMPMHKRLLFYLFYRMHFVQLKWSVTDKKIYNLTRLFTQNRNIDITCWKSNWLDTDGFCVIRVTHKKKKSELNSILWVRPAIIIAYRALQTSKTRIWLQFYSHVT